MLKVSRFLQIHPKFRSLKSDRVQVSYSLQIREIAKLSILGISRKLLDSDGPT